MAALRPLPLLLMLRTLTSPAGGLLTSWRGAAPPSPFQNLRVEPNEHRLSWDRVTSGPRAVCRQDGRSPVREDPGRNLCAFPSLSLCRVTNFSVSLDDDPDSVAWVLFPPSDPAHHAAAVTGLECHVHDVIRMTCRWGRGPGAPGDVQYRMFWGDARHSRAGDHECPHYDVRDAAGTLLGCVLDDITVLQLPPQVMVTVTAVARAAPVPSAPAATPTQGPLPCADLTVDLALAEELAPPTLTASCNGSEARVHWAPRSLFPRVFQYDLEVHKSSNTEPEVVTTNHTHHRVPHAGSTSFRVQARLWGTERRSGWSPARGLDCGPGKASIAAVTAGSTAAAGAGLVALATWLLLCRRPLKAKLFPRIPRMKDPVGAEPGETVPWATAPEDCPVTPVTEA